MSTHPFIPLYVDDYDAATAHLSAEEDGVYSRLIRLCWRTPGCSLPADMAWIGRKIRLSAEDFERVGQAVLDEFFTPHRGRLIQKRLKREYDAISRKKSARKLAGKKGGDAKALKEQEKSASNATSLLPHTRAFPEPEPEPERKIEATASLSLIADEPTVDAFEPAWRAYPHVKGRSSKAKARQAWSKLSLAARAGLLAAVGRYAAEGREPRMDCGAPAMERWLRDGRFEDWLTPSADDPPTPPDPDGPWRARLREFAKNGYWNTVDWGPKPGREGCEAPANLLAGSGVVLPFAAKAVA